jgi:peptidoglycan/LPS O-acetylase OafA/YrhL
MLSKLSLAKQVLARWVRLAFPAYFVLLIALNITPLLASGPVYMYFNQRDILEEIEKNWWSYLIMINNVYPENGYYGLYWLAFVANEMQFYIFVMMPAIYFYQKRQMRRVVLGFLACLILSSILFLSITTYIYSFSTILTFDIKRMYDYIFRYPFG